MISRRYSGPTAPLWCLTYGDLLTNILCFFVMLLMFTTFGMKKANKQESRALSTAFEQPMGTTQNRGVYQWLVSGGKGVLLLPNPRNFSEIPRIVRRLKGQVQGLNMRDQVFVAGDSEGVKIRVPAKVMFQGGAASLKTDGEQILGALAAVIGESKHFVRIDSHCDDRLAKGSAYPSNWELSSARACSVLRYFTEKKGLEAGRFSAQGFADSRPETDNITDADRENNRRIEIMILAGKPKARGESQWE